MKLPSSHGTPGYLDWLLPSANRRIMPAAMVGVQEQYALFFFGKERAPSESVLGVRAVPLFTENPRRCLLGNRASGIPDFRKCNFVLCNALRTARSICYTGQAYSASCLEEFFSETQGS